ncbi:restriction endonuclease [Chryseobacterium sp.]|uniref:restriction endonuclease n=1 Tax=Chryseobacterium sp. TaxID=1871047 RepID=UPI0031D36E9E
MKPGKEYELLIANMYRSLEPNAEITHDDHIYDGTAKIKRQIDVSIKYKLAGVDILIIVQAKDYKHKANVTVVDQFKTVIDDTKASKGILICSKGFSDAALTKAAFHNIECLTIHSALNKKWESIVNIPVKKVVHEFDLNIDFLIDVRDKGGKEVTWHNDTFSYDGLNLIGAGDIAMDHIIKKMGWYFITKSKEIKIDLKKIGVNCLFDMKMVKLDNGHLTLKYKSTKQGQFYVIPSDYIFEKNHVKGSEKLHEMRLPESEFDRINNTVIENDKDCTELPLINTTVYNFKNIGKFISSTTFKIKGLIDGLYYIKDEKIMTVDGPSTAIVNLENKLKGIE